MAPGTAPAAARDRVGADAPAETSSSPRGAASSSSSPRSARRSSSSRTCTGPTRRCSRSSRTWRTRPAAVPLLVLGTTRPELFDRRPAFPGSGDAPSASTSDRCSADAAEDLARRCSMASSWPTRSASRSSTAPAGNPLFVEEFIRLLRDRDLLVASDGRLDLREGAALPVPDSIQALLAARLDALPAEAKSVLTDAAVVGKVFWGGAVRRIGERETRPTSPAARPARGPRVHPGRAALVDGRRDASTRSGTSSSATSRTRPCRGRLARHGTSPRPGGSRSGPADRVEDVADVLAHHYSTALDLARAVGDDAGAAALEAPALPVPADGGRTRGRARRRRPRSAVLERALALAPAGHPERPAVLRRYGQALGASGRSKEAVLAYEEALEGFRAVDDGRGHGRRPGQAVVHVARPRRRSRLDLRVGGRRAARATRAVVAAGRRAV